MRLMVFPTMVHPLYAHHGIPGYLRGVTPGYLRGVTPGYLRGVHIPPGYLRLVGSIYTRLTFSLRLVGRHIHQVIPLP